jgi:hypothetical protein
MHAPADQMPRAASHFTSRRLSSHPRRAAIGLALMGSLGFAATGRADSQRDIAKVCAVFDEREAALVASSPADGAPWGELMQRLGKLNQGELSSPGVVEAVGALYSAAPQVRQGLWQRTMQEKHIPYNCPSMERVLSYELAWVRFRSLCRTLEGGDALHVFYQLVEIDQPPISLLQPSDKPQATPLLDAVLAQERGPKRAEIVLAAARARGVTLSCPGLAKLATLTLSRP